MCIDFNSKSFLLIERISVTLFIHCFTLSIGPDVRFRVRELVSRQSDPSVTMVLKDGHKTYYH